MGFVFYFLIVAFILLYCYHRGFVDVDLFSRLIMGKHVIETGSVMYKDIVSYTPTHIWFDHEWLSSAFFYLILDKFKLSSLVVFKAICCFLIYFLVDLNIVQKENKFWYDYKIIYFALFFYFFYDMLFNSLRCQDFSFVFYTLTLLILEKQRKNYSSKIILILPLLMLLWLNIHGGSMYALGIIFLYGLGEFLNKKPWKKYFLILIPSLAAYFINPWGVDFVKFLFGAIFIKRQYIGEWNSPFSMTPFLVAQYIVNIFFILSAYFWNFYKTRKIDWTKTLILFCTFLIALKHIKFNPLFFITVLIFMYDDFKRVFDSIKKLVRFNFSLSKIVIVAFVTYGIFLFLSNPFNNLYEKTVKNSPCLPLEFLKENNIRGNIFAPYYLGGFLSYKGYPDLKIYIDGRQEEVYDYDLLEKQMQFLFYIGSNPLSVLREYKPDIILIEKHWMANKWLYYQNYFKPVYDDNKYFIYLAPDAQKFNYIMPQRAQVCSLDNLFKTKLNFKKAY